MPRIILEFRPDDLKAGHWVDLTDVFEGKWSDSGFKDEALFLPLRRPCPNQLGSHIIFNFGQKKKGGYRFTFEVYQVEDHVAHEYILILRRLIEMELEDDHNKAMSLLFKHMFDWPQVKAWAYGQEATFPAK